jgi:ribosomal 50S subunit-recycling heat shock protein
MKYSDGSSVKLGDIIAIPLPSGTAKARVVMLGDTREHLDIDK